MTSLLRASPPAPVRIAIVGAGNMAHQHARKFQSLAPACSMCAAVDIVPERAEAFCREFKIPHAFTSAELLLEQSDCNAVSIVTPDALHAPQSIQCLRAGRHVLCEKPLALSYSDAKRMVAAARRSGTMNMVNLSYRDWPALQGVADVVRSGGIGEVRHVEASYLQCWLSSKVWGDWRTSPTWLWRLSRAHGSNGVLGDVGVHIVDFATFPAGPISEVFCRLKTFDKAPRNRIGEYVLDANDSAVLTVTFRNGALGTIHATRWASGHKNRLHLKISGTLGAVEIDSERAVDRYRICSGAGLDLAEWHEVEVPPTPSNYERFVTSIVTRKQDQPSFNRGAEMQKVIDACFESHEAARPVKV